MKYDKENKQVIRTEADKARHKAIRERFKHKPTIDELTESGELVGNTVLPGEVYLELSQLVGIIKQAREAAGMSLGDLSRASGIDKAALSRLEAGIQANPTIGTLGRIADAMGLELRFQVATRSRTARGKSPANTTAHKA